LFSSFLSFIPEPTESPEKLHYVSQNRDSQQSTHQGFSPVPYLKLSFFYPYSQRRYLHRKLHTYLMVSDFVLSHCHFISASPWWAQL